ncbi:MAG TPA: hypothetical protein VF138_01610 [Caulobacteraceae bacterium]
MANELDIATAISRIFLAVEDLHSKGVSEAKGSRLRREAIHFLWETREQSKFDANRPHSVAARAYRATGATELLRYEHSIPLASYMPVLRKAAKEPELMLAALKRYVRPVIVLEDECRMLTKCGLASRLPVGAAPDDALARYRQAGIEIEA